VPYPVPIDSANFPDATFSNYVKANFDTDGDGLLSQTEADSVKSISVQSSGIASLEGIEYFISLENLYCYDNQLTSLDVTNNPALHTLYCNDNQLISLDVTSSSKLLYLYCNDNQLISLDVSSSSKLFYLDCSDNQLISLDVSKNSELHSLYCNDNQLTSLDVTKTPELRWFSCSDNQLTSLDVSKNFELPSLDCNNNQLTSLDVTNNSKLRWFYCSDNQLTSLDLSKNLELEVFYCSNNQLTSLDLSKNPVLEEFYCTDNQLTSLDLSKNLKLEEFGCNNNQLTSLDVSKNSELAWFYCTGNQLTSLDLTNNPLLTELHCQDNHLLDVTGWSGAGVTASDSQTVNMGVSAAAAGSGLFVSNTAFAFYAGHTISFPTGAAQYDSATGLFTTTQLNTPIPFTTSNGMNQVASGLITFAFSYTVVYEPGAHGTWAAADETYTVNTGDAVPAFGTKSGADVATAHDEGWTFDRWSTSIDPVTGDETYTALWKPDTTALPKTGDGAAVSLILGALGALCAGVVLFWRRAAHRQRA
jgi:LPXTG-motif cell wall-anchored protein